jgi:hypothetical protein
MRAAGHVHQVLRLGPGDVGVASLRVAHRDLGQHLGHVGRRDRLHEQRRDGGHAVLLRPARHHRGEVVELRRRHDRPRHRARLHQAFLLALAGVVGVAHHPPQSHDRQQHVVAHAGPRLGVEQVARGGGEVGHRLLGGSSLAVDRVHYRVHSGQRGVEPLAGHEVHAEGSADAHHVMAVPFEGGGGEAPMFPVAPATAILMMISFSNLVSPRPYLGLNRSAISAICCRS